MHCIRTHCWYSCRRREDSEIANMEVARRAAQAVDIQVKADAETGYGDPIHVMRTVKEFERAGIATIQIEDQVFPKRASYHHKPILAPPLRF